MKKILFCSIINIIFSIGFLGSMISGENGKDKNLKKRYERCHPEISIYDMNRAVKILKERIKDKPRSNLRNGTVFFDND